MYDTQHCPCCGRPIEEPPLGQTRFVIDTAGSSFTVSDDRLETPRLYGNGNVLWPHGWTCEQRRVWRMMMDLPGFEWRGEGSKP